MPCSTYSTTPKPLKEDEKMKILSLSAHSHADEKSNGVSLFAKHFRGFTEKHSCSVKSPSVHCWAWKKGVNNCLGASTGRLGLHSSNYMSFVFLPYKCLQCCFAVKLQKCHLTLHWHGSVQKMTEVSFSWLISVELLVNSFWEDLTL